MRLLLYSGDDPASDLALEEAIQLELEDGRSPGTWRLWQAAKPAVIIGTGQESAREAQLDATEAEGVAVLRRHSGGGAVVIGPGTINFSAILEYATLPGSETIAGAMSAALRPVIELLQSWGIAARESGLSDLAAMGHDGTLRKIAGNSQARKKRTVVVHGTLLADPDWARIERLLRFPSRVPDYRAGRGHRDFLTSLSELGAPSDLNSFVDGLLPRLPSGIVTERAPLQRERERAAALLVEKYGNQSWNFRR